MRALVTWMALVAAGVPFGGTAHRLAEQGNDHYRAGDLDEALRAYTEAQVARPDAPELLYDIGNVLYRKDDWASAQEAFERAAAAADPSLGSKASFNLGNALFRQERFQDAAEAYRRALELAPEDPDAKRNLELALQRAQTQRQDRPQPDSQPDTSQDPSSEAPPSGSPDRGQDGDRQDPGSDGKEPPPDERASSQPPPRSGGEGGERSDDRASASEAPSGMSKEEAERLLDGLEGEERDNLRRLAEKNAKASDVRREKDW